MKVWRLVAPLALISALSTPALAASRKIRIAPPDSFPSGGTKPNCVAAGDFNRDGRLDVAVTNNKEDTVGVLLGNGDGTLKTAVTYSVDQGSSPVCIAIGDFNRDGRLDLAVPAALTGGNGGNISILLGNGDGTFQPQYFVTSGVSPLSIIIADLNGDEKLDMFIGGNGSSSVLLGNGDGTFQAPAIYAGLDWSVAVADFNRDGHPDLVGANFVDNTVRVLLNNGDGTFHSGVTVPVGLFPDSIAADDFNADSVPDLAVASSDDSLVTILLGKGDGTFQSGVTYLAGDFPTSVQAADFNGDGALDLVIADAGANSVTVLQGNAVGSFRSAGRFASGYGPIFVAVGDFNRDGAPDVTVANVGDNTVSVLLNRDGVTVNLASSLNPSQVGQSVTFTARVRSSLGEPPVPTGSITFKDGSTVLGTIAVNSGEARLTTSSLAVGSHNIQARYAGDSNYIRRASPVLVQVVTQ